VASVQTRPVAPWHSLKCKQHRFLVFVFNEDSKTFTKTLIRKDLRDDLLNASFSKHKDCWKIQIGNGVLPMEI